jgi:hypothetical protein
MDGSTSVLSVAIPFLELVPFCLLRKPGEMPLIHHQGIICGVAFPPEAGKRSLLLAAYCSIRLTRRSSASSI